MISMTLHEKTKETENKVRWDADVGGTPFELYIPKWRVPEPWPALIRVEVSDHAGYKPSSLSPSVAQNAPDRRNDPIIARVKKFKEHTETIRYQPEGIASDWEIGEPYVPFSMTYGRKEHLTILVHWK